jgi:uncharacterized protein (DUF1919 family)
MFGRTKSRIIGSIDRSRLKRDGFAIVSNNCWGAEAYSSVGRPYNTPFVGLYLYPECYTELLSNLYPALEAHLTFTRNSQYLKNPPKYPVGLVTEGVEIHFLHYASEDEARAKWDRRAKRFLESVSADESVFLKFCDRDGCKLSHIERFHDLPYDNKVSFGVVQYDHPNHLFVPGMKSSNENSVIDGQSLFRQRYACFDFAHWIRTGKIERTLMSQMLGLIS